MIDFMLSEQYNCFNEYIIYARKPYDIFAVASVTIQGFYIYWHVFVLLIMRDKIMLKRV